MRVLFLFALMFAFISLQAQVTLHDWYYSDPAKHQIFSTTNEVLNNMNKSNYSSGTSAPMSYTYVANFKIKLFEAIKDRRDSIRQVKATEAKTVELRDKGCYEGDCQNGYGVLYGGMLPGNSYFVDYSGDFKNGLPHGSGKMSHFGLDYVGDFVNGKKHGNGVAEYSGFHAKSRYVGQWKEDVWNGKGTLFHENGVVFSGQWENNRLPKGTAILPDSNVFEGRFEKIKDIHVTGFGTITYRDGSKKTGLVQNGKMVYEAEKESEVPESFFKKVLPVYELITEKRCVNEDESSRWILESNLRIKEAVAKQLAELEARLEAGADPDENDALHMACRKGRLDIVELLLKYGADPLRKTSTGAMPIDDAILPNLGCNESIADGMVIIEVLIKNGTPPDHKTKNGKFTISYSWYHLFNHYGKYGEPLAAEWARKLMALGVRFDVPCGHNDKSVLELCKEKNKKLYKILKAEMGE